MRSGNWETAVTEVAMLGCRMNARTLPVVVAEIVADSAVAGILDAMILLYSVRAGQLVGIRMEK